MKEKRLRDGKKDRRGWGSVRRIEEEPRDTKVSKVQARTKEARYSIRRGRESFALFDPEECLHVGKHNGKVGIVYRFKRLIWNGDPRDYSPSGERGLLRWEGGDWKSLVYAAAVFALERSGQKVATAGAAQELSKPGAWGKKEFWEDLATRYRTAMNLQAVQDVMDA